MTKVIDTKKYERYIKFDKAWDLLEELENSQYSQQTNFKKADQALAFLKEHTEDNEFEREATTGAIIKALDYLENFEQTLRQQMIEGIAEDKRRSKVAHDAHKKANDVFEKKIKPSLESIIAEIESLNTITGYSSHFLSNNIENIVQQIRKSARI